MKNCRKTIASLCSVFSVLASAQLAAESKKPTPPIAFDIYPAASLQASYDKLKARWGWWEPPFWTPSVAQVKGIEAQLLDHLANKSELPNAEFVHKEFYQYHRLYFGFTFENRKKVSIQGQCANSGYQPVPMMVSDGGRCFFSAVYDLESQDFDEVFINGSA